MIMLSLISCTHTMYNSLEIKVLLSMQPTDSPPLVVSGMCKNYCIYIYIPELKISRINWKEKFLSVIFPILCHLLFKSHYAKIFPRFNIPELGLVGKNREYLFLAKIYDYTEYQSYFTTQPTFFLLGLLSKELKDDLSSNGKKLWKVILVPTKNLHTYTKLKEISSQRNIHSVVIKNYTWRRNITRFRISAEHMNKY